MTAVDRAAGREREALAAVLAVTRLLAAPFDLRSMLVEVTAVATRMLRAERASVWLLDAARGELVCEVSSDLGSVRVPVGAGLVGACAQDRAIVNVPDCYADLRFNPAVDRDTGFRTRCSLSLPLIDHREELVGVMQLVNRSDGGVFTVADEPLAATLAAQCAMALSRVRMSEALRAGELLRQEMAMAELMQRSTLPKAWPTPEGYDLHAVFLPASLTGGDTYDLAMVGPELLVVLGDATGHGIGPAMSVTRMHAMLRMALRLSGDLGRSFREVNDQLAQVLPDGHFVTAFIGLLDPATHVLRYLSGGQGPILHVHGGSGDCTVHRANSFPMGAMPLPAAREPARLVLAAGDWLVLASDGLYEAEDPDGNPFGRARTEAVIRAHRDARAHDLAERLLQAAKDHARGAAAGDDITIVLVRRLPDA